MVQGGGVPSLQRAGPEALGVGATPVSVDPVPTQLANKTAIRKQIESFMLHLLALALTARILNSTQPLACAHCYHPEKA
jgi:hypothetical protein